MKLATSETVSTAIPPTLTIAATAVSPGGTIGIVVADGPANPTDWVGLFPTAANDSSYQHWTYLNGLRVPPVAGQSSATLQFTAPTVPGSYNVRLFANNGFTRLATSGKRSIVAAVPTLTINDVTVTEGNGGTTTAAFTVSLSPVNSSQSVTVGYATANGTASGGDYTPASGTLTFNPSIATQTINVTVNPDTVFEPNETFLVNLSNPVNAVIGDAQGVGTITDDDTQSTPGITVTTPTVNPGGTISFVVANGPANPLDWVGLYAATDSDTSFQEWSYLNGLKVAPVAGQSNATLQFVAPTVMGTYQLRLFANNGYTRLATSAVITVSTVPTLTINDVSMIEGTSGVSTAIFTVSLSPQNASQTVTVAYATADGTASVSNGDYLAASGTLTFNPSAATRTINVTVIGDSPIEPNETFTVNLSNPTNAVIGDAQGVGTIINDDSPGIFLNTPNVHPGDTISFTLTNGPRNTTDWLGLFSSGAGDTAFVDWIYLNGLKVAPIAAPPLPRTLEFVAPAVAGVYNIRFFANNGYGLLTTSATVTVSP